MKSEVYFADKKLKEAFESLESDDSLRKWISATIEKLRHNAFCGTQIRKSLIPNAYLQKYNIDNLWKYDLPKGWRLLYSVAKDEVTIISIILDWMKHKDYEKRFNY